MTDDPRDADDLVAQYGSGAIGWHGAAKVSEADGVAILAAVAGEIEAAAGGSKAARMAPLVALYKDRTRFRAVYVSAVQRSAEVEAEIMRIGLVIGDKPADKLRGKIRESQRAEVRKSLRIVGAGDDGEPHEVRVAVDWPEYPAGVAVDRGWSLTPSSLGRWVSSGGEMRLEHVGVPVLATRRLVDADDGTWSLEVAWQAGEAWSTARVPRSVALDARGLVKMADQGLPVSSATASRVVEWLTLLDQHPDLPTDRGAARMGWVGRARDTYLMGSRAIGEGEGACLVTTSPGARQLAESIVPSGTWAGWCAVMSAVGDRPGLWLAVYAAACAPLLRLLDAPNFGIDFAGRQGSGKTTALEVATSTYGMPRNGRGYRSWGATIAGAEGTAGVMCDLPLALNEGQLVPATKRVEAGALLYALVEGSGRAKGALGRLGLASVDDWRTVLISTSEEGITTWAPTDGVRARILEIHEPPTASAEQSEWIQAEIREHHGHLLPRLVERLAGMSHAKLDALRAVYRDAIDRYAATATSKTARRAARYMATIDVAAGHIHALLGVPKPAADVLGWAWARIQDSCGEADQALRAIEVVRTWVRANAGNFASADSDVRTPAGGWLGWRAMDGDFTGVVPKTLKRVLSEAGFGDSGAILRQWSERGWTRCNRGRVDYYMRIGRGVFGERAWVVALLDEGTADDGASETEDP